MTSPYCQLCGFQPPDPVAYHERTAELAAAREEIRRLRKLVWDAYMEGVTRGTLGEPLDSWSTSTARTRLGPDVARPG